MADTYYTIEAPSEGTFTEKRSKFLAFAFPVQTAAEAKTHVDALSKKYFDARHVCWAYMLGPDRTDFRANDNGEPSGTAGKPILGQINSAGLTDVLVAVVRYFGGIKLGTSGLIVAYREAAREALAAATVVERHQTRRYTFSYPYAVIDRVMRLTREDGVRVIDSRMDNSCLMTLEVNLDAAAGVEKRLADIDGISIIDNQSNENE